MLGWRVGRVGRVSFLSVAIYRETACVRGSATVGLDMQAAVVLLLFYRVFSVILRDGHTARLPAALLILYLQRNVPSLWSSG